MWWFWKNNFAEGLPKENLEGSGTASWQDQTFVWVCHGDKNPLTEYVLKALLWTVPSRPNGL